MRIKILMLLILSLFCWGLIAYLVHAHKWANSTGVQYHPLDKRGEDIGNIVQTNKTRFTKDGRKMVEWRFEDGHTQWSVEEDLDAH